MSEIDCRRISVAQAAEARSIIARAFSMDPLIEWLFPRAECDGADRLDAIATFYWPSVESYASLGSGHVAVDGDRLVGVALWNVPSAGVQMPTLPSASGVARILLGDKLSELSEGMRTARGDRALPQGAYLHDLAVSPDHRGQGIGSALVEVGLREFGMQGAWLETTNPENQSLYERAGFAAVYAGPVGDSGVTMTRMIASGSAETAT